MPTTPPGPLARANYLNWPPGPYQAQADPNSSSFDPALAVPAGGNPTYGDAALDAEQYHRPLERLHGTGLHAPGVAFGMQITCTTGQANVVIMPGVALDASGRHIYLADGGSAEIGANASVPNTPPDLAPVSATGVTLPTAGYTGDYYVVVQWWETWNSAGYASDPNIGQYNDTPWLQLIAQADYQPDVHVVLGKLGLDAASNVTAADYGDVGGLQRTSVSVPAQSLLLNRAVTTTAPPGANTASWGEVRAREAGGVEIAVANNSDQVNVLSDAGGSFLSFGVGANQAIVGDLANPGITLDGAEATVRVGAPGNYGDVFVYDGNSNLAVSLIGDTGHVIVGGNTLPGKVRMLNADRQDTMSLNGDTGSAVVQRVQAFANNLIDVDSRFLHIHGWDLALDGRSGNNNRALVDWGNQLIINFAGDYGNGVVVNSDLQVDRVLRDGQGTPLMGNPARKASSTFLFVYAGRTTSDVVLPGGPRQFTAFCSHIMIDSTTDFDYDNATSVEVYKIDGNPTGSSISGGGNGGGPKYGPPGDDRNVHQPFVTGFGQTITFRLAALGPDLGAAAVGIVFYE